MLPGAKLAQKGQNGMDKIIIYLGNTTTWSAVASASVKDIISFIEQGIEGNATTQDKTFLQRTIEENVWNIAELLLVKGDKGLFKYPLR